MFLLIAFLKNPEISLGNIGGSDLQVFRKASLMAIYLLHTFAVVQRYLSEVTILAG